MPRAAHKYVFRADGRAARAGVDSGPEQFAETMGYARLDGFGSREEFLRLRAGAPWVAEVRDVLRRLLRRDRPALCLGSGVGEFEAPLAAEGYDVTASDLVPGVLDRTKALFPELKVRVADALALDVAPGEYPDVADMGILFYYDDAEAARVFAEVRRVLPRGGRFISVLRYNDNAATRALDEWVQPVEAGVKNFFKRLRGLPGRWVRKRHGFRRSRAETEALGRAAGFRLKSLAHAAFGMELTRSGLAMRLPGLFRAARAADRALAVFNIATIFEFKAEA